MINDIMTDDKITILYQIKGIRPCIKQEGYVEVLMSPIDKLSFDEENNDDVAIKVTGVGPEGGLIPPEVLQNINKMMKSSLPPHLRSLKDKDPRNFLHVETEIDFLSRGWKYGDTVAITLKKVDQDNPSNLDGSDIK